MDKDYVVVFDSGFGGLSVLKRLIKTLPGENFIYYGDNANAPYGPRPQKECEALILNALDPLFSPRCKAIVLACNTATAAAGEVVTARYAPIPVIGIEPAVRAAAKKHNRVLCLATQGTLASARFARQLESIPSDVSVFPVPAVGIVPFVESGMKDPEGFKKYMSGLLAEFIAKPVGAVVLGCTHYPFVADIIAEVLGYPVEFYDAGKDVAVETKAALENNGTAEKYNGTPGEIEFLSSAMSDEYLRFAKELLSHNIPD